MLLALPSEQVADALREETAIKPALLAYVEKVFAVVLVRDYFNSLLEHPAEVPSDTLEVLHGEKGQEKKAEKGQKKKAVNDGGDKDKIGDAMDVQS